MHASHQNIYIAQNHGLLSSVLSDQQQHAWESAHLAASSMTCNRFHLQLLDTAMVALLGAVGNSALHKGA